MPSGGKRKGAGRPEGTQNASTKARALKFERFVAKVFHEYDDVVRAQLDLAKGLHVMFAREWETKNNVRARTGKFKRVSGVKDIETILNGDAKPGEDYHYISLQDPDGAMLANIMDRLHGKPSQGVDITGTGPDGAIKVEVHHHFAVTP